MGRILNAFLMIATLGLVEATGDKCTDFRYCASVRLRRFQLRALLRVAPGPALAGEIVTALDEFAIKPPL